MRTRPFAQRLVVLMVVCLVVVLVMRLLGVGNTGTIRTQALNGIYWLASLWLGWQAWRDGTFLRPQSTARLNRVLVTFLGCLAGASGAVTASLLTYVILPTESQPFTASQLLYAVGAGLFVTAFGVAFIHVRRLDPIAPSESQHGRAKGI